MATGTIAVDPSTPPQLGQPLNFIWSLDGAHGNVSPRIQVLAYQDTDADGQVDDLVYGEAYPAGGFNPLGGGGSLWLTNGGPAHCVATLYSWQQIHGQQTFVPYATVEFDAAGA